MLNENDMHQYQHNMVDFVLENKRCGVYADMGLGKTVISLTALAKMFDNLSTGKALIIAPKRPSLVTWPAEIKKWQQASHLSYKVLTGLSQVKRKAALKGSEDIHIINRENVKWLVTALGKKWPYDTVIIDESHSFKSSKSQRFRALRKMSPFISKMVHLSGTPATNGLMNLWAQIFLLDNGERLGKSFVGFKNRYFDSDYMGYKLTLKEESEEIIHEKISDITVSLDVDDYLKLPDKVETTVKIQLNSKLRDQYDTLQADELLEIGDDTITAANAAGVINKLSQFANGAIYNNPDTKDYTIIHEAKLDALEELIENANGKPVLIVYNYQHDMKRIIKRFKAETLKDDKTIKRWNAGKIDKLLVHPGSAGTGLNIQEGGNIIIWFGPTWNLEHKLQMDARLHRQGQTSKVLVHTIIVEGTVDELIIAAQNDKSLTQASLLRTLKYEC